MASELFQGQAAVLIRQSAFERIGLSRSAIDQRYNLTDQEFRVEDGLVVIGPLPSDDLLPELIEGLESSGLVYYEDFFELSGNWPDWLSLYVRGAKGRGT
ncbi:MAG: hypothetical protein ACJ79N_03220 [Gemmatimonadaceae bacterium]